MPPLRLTCWECRRRRKVCGAEKPSCIRCTADGIQCPGYSLQKPLRFNTPNQTRYRGRGKKPLSDTPPSDDVSICASEQSDLPLSGLPDRARALQRCPDARSVTQHFVLPLLSYEYKYFDDSDEADGFQHFRDWTARYHPDPAAIPLWEDHGFRVAITEPALRKVLSTVGMVTLSESNVLETWASAPFRTYCSAIVATRKALQDRQNIELILVVCLLFVYVEFRMSNWAQAFMHLRAGVRLYNDWEPAEDATGLSKLLISGSLLYSVLPVEALKLQHHVQDSSSTLPTSSPGSLTPRDQVSAFGRLPRLPISPFASVLDANTSAAAIAAQTRSLERKVGREACPGSCESMPDDSKRVQKTLLKACDSWNVCIRKFMQTGLEPSALHQGLLLQLRLLSCKTMITTVLDRERELSWDEATPDFAKMCEVARLAIVFEESMQKPFNSGSAISLLLNLSHVAQKCRDWTIRTAAVALMRRCADAGDQALSQHLANACELVIQLEHDGESRACVPEYRRFVRVNVEFDQDGRLSIHLHRRCHYCRYMVQYDPVVLGDSDIDPNKYIHSTCANCKTSTSEEQPG